MEHNDYKTCDTIKTQHVQLSLALVIMGSYSPSVTGILLNK